MQKPDATAEAGHAAAAPLDVVTDAATAAAFVAAAAAAALVVGQHLLLNLQRTISHRPRKVAAHIIFRRINFILALR